MTTYGVIGVKVWVYKGEVIEGGDRAGIHCAMKASRAAAPAAMEIAAGSVETAEEIVVGSAASRRKVKRIRLRLLKRTARSCNNRRLRRSSLDRSFNRLRPICRDRFRHPLFRPFQVQSLPPGSRSGSPSVSRPWRPRKERRPRL